MDTGTDRTQDSDADGQWLTYGELASIRRIDRHSAVKLVTRHRWRRQKDNRDVLRIFVPTEWAMSKDRGTDQATDMGTDTGTDAGTDAGTDIVRAIDALQTALAAANERADRLDLLIETERGKLLAAEIRATAAEGALVQVRAHTDAAEADRRAAIERADVAESRQRWAEDRVEGLRDLLTEAERRAAGAEDARKTVMAHADALERAEFERQARGRWARLRAAWRGE